MDFREQAIKDVANSLKWSIEATEAALRVGSLILVYAVAQRESRLRLEDALRKLSERYEEWQRHECTTHDFYCCMYDARAALDAGKEG